MVYQASMDPNYKYMVSMEVAGPYAMWTNAGSGDSPVSYPVPTFSAVKGLFESILFVPWAQVTPIKVEICRPIRFTEFHFNYGGPLRKDNDRKKNNSYQAKWTILEDVCYRLYAIPKGNREFYDKGNSLFTSNGAHAYQERFNRVLLRGGYRMVPHLGCKEFDAWYCGSFRDATRIAEEINICLPTMLYSCFSHHFEGVVCPEFRQRVCIKNGVLEYA